MKILINNNNFGTERFLFFIDDLFNKYDEHKILVSEENILFDNIIQTYGVLRCSIDELYQSLKLNHKEYILDVSSTWIQLVISIDLFFYL